MDLALIKKATTAYRACAADDAAHAIPVDMLTFFEGVWELQHEEIERCESEHQVRLGEQSQEVSSGPSESDIEEAFGGGEPLTKRYPLTISHDEFVSACKKIASYVVEHADFGDTPVEGLREFGWETILDDASLDLLCREPENFLLQLQESYEKSPLIDGISPALFMTIPRLAVRIFADTFAQTCCKVAHKQLKHAVPNHDRSLTCPICGAHAQASWVGEGAALDGRGRMMFCSLCGAEWDYERIRCGSCGSQHAGHLHYFHVEGDSAHRLQLCDECGNYQRIVFREELKVPFSMDVEEVVMTRLDHIAHDPRFRVEHNGDS